MQQQDDVLNQICKCMDAKDAQKFKKYVEENAQFVTPSDLDKFLAFFSLLQQQNHYDFYITGKLIFHKKYAEDIGASIFEFLPNSQVSKFSGYCERFCRQLQTIRKQAIENGIAASKWITDDVCRLLENHDKPMLLITYENKIFKGLVNIVPDRKQNLYHFISAEGGLHRLMDTKAVITLPDERCIYYNDYLNYLPPKESYIKKFGEQVQMAFNQEARYTELGAKY